MKLNLTHHSDSALSRHKHGMKEYEECMNNNTHQCMHWCLEPHRLAQTVCEHYVKVC